MEQPGLELEGFAARVGLAAALVVVLAELAVVKAAKLALRRQSASPSFAGQKPGFVESLADPEQELSWSPSSRSLRSSKAESRRTFGLRLGFSRQFDASRILLEKDVAGKRKKSNLLQRHFPPKRVRPSLPYVV